MLVSSSQRMQLMLLCRVSCSWLSDILRVRQASKNTGALGSQEASKNGCINK